MRESVMTDRAWDILQNYNTSSGDGARRAGGHDCLRYSFGSTGNLGFG